MGLFNRGIGMRLEIVRPWEKVNQQRSAERISLLATKARPQS